MSFKIKIKPFGAQAVLLEWPNEVSLEILEDILQFESHLKEHHLKTSEWEMIPAYNSLTLFQKKGNIQFKKFKRSLKDWYKSTDQRIAISHHLWKLPVCYDKEFGIDLPEVASLLNITEAEVIDMHTSNVYTVFGIGFLPGFMYLGGLPPELETPRRAEPRLKVNKGSVGLAGKQTGIYPQESPGGWNIIGNCPIPIFNIKREDPCFVNIGDSISFYPISKGEYDLHKIEAEVGIFKIEKTKLNA